MGDDRRSCAQTIAKLQAAGSRIDDVGKTLEEHPDVRPSSSFVLSALHAEDRADRACDSARTNGAATPVARCLMYSFERAERQTLQNALLREQGVLLPL